MMRAIQQDEPRGTLSWREVPVPQPQAGEVLVRVAAAPINPSDLGSLSGLTYGTPRSYPFIPGVEGSGVVVAAGQSWLARFLKGKRVACTAARSGGTWAEYMLTSARLCLPLRQHVSLEQAAMLLVNPLTAVAIMDIARRGKHSAIVSTAAASALGGMLLALGRRYRVPIVHIVRRQDQVDLVHVRGGEVVVNSSEPGFGEHLREAVERYHPTLWLDAIGGPMTQQLAEAAPYGSTILLYSRLSGQPSVIDPGTALIKNLRFEGWLLANWAREKTLLEALRISRQVQSLVSSDLRSPVNQCIPLSEAQQGVERYLESMTAGKILLVANPGEVGLGSETPEVFETIPR